MKYKIVATYKLFVPKIYTEKIKHYLVEQRKSNYLYNQELTIEHLEGFFTKFEHYRLDELKSYLFSNYRGLDLKNLSHFSEINGEEVYHFNDQDSIDIWKPKQNLLFKNQISSIESILSTKIGEVTTHYGGNYIFTMTFPSSI